jgi:hypothetical protein
MIERFDREVGGCTMFAYEQMVLAAAMKDTATAFEIYFESARIEVFGAHGLSVADEPVTWSRDLRPFIKNTHRSSRLASWPTELNCQRTSDRGHRCTCCVHP